MKSPTLPILVAAAVFSAISAPVSRAATVERRVRAMGTDLAIAVAAAHRPDALEASERAVAALRRAEMRLSTWTIDSELSRFNAAPAGRVVAITSLLARDLDEARRCSLETDGAFSPGLGSLVRDWGLRSGGRIPTDTEIASVLPALRAANLVVDGHTATRLDDRFVVEEGGFGKGVGLDDAAGALAGSPATGAVFDFGGQVAVWGEASVAIDVADPRDRDRVVLRLSISRGSVATTGNSERGIVVGGKRLGHVLDPATGRPARDFGSVTVWAERAVRADCLATGLYVMGPDRALAWAAGRSDVGVIVLEAGARGLQARASANLRDRLEPAAADLELVIDDTPEEGP